MTPDKPLQIQFLTNFEHEQGTYFRFHNLAIGLTQLGQNVTIFAADHEPKSRARDESRDGIQYHVVPVSRGFSLFGHGCHPVTALRRAARAYPSCDVRHLFQPFPSAALPWQTHPNARVRFYDWDDLFSGGLLGKPNSIRTAWEAATIKWYENTLPGQAQTVTTCSHFLADLACQRHARNTLVLPNGIWPYEKRERREARMSLQLNPDALYVGFMGRTTNELAWCFEAMSQNLAVYPRLRFALCGAGPSFLEGLAPDVRERVDYLGQLTHLQTRDFAAALDLGLLPLEDNAFNQSRFPIKYAEYMAAGAPVLCSDVGECSHLSAGFPWVVSAGTTRQDWLGAFQKVLPRLAEGQVPRVSLEAVSDQFSWLEISRRLLHCYREALLSENRCLQEGGCINCSH